MANATKSTVSTVSTESTESTVSESTLAEVRRLHATLGNWGKVAATLAKVGIAANDIQAAIDIVKAEISDHRNRFQSDAVAAGNRVADAKDSADPIVRMNVTMIQAVGKPLFKSVKASRESDVNRAATIVADVAAILDKFDDATADAIFGTIGKGLLADCRTAMQSPLATLSRGRSIYAEVAALFGRAETVSEINRKSLA